MTQPVAEPLPDSAEDLFEDAPCGYLTTELDGTIIRVNRTFEQWTGHRRDTLLGQRRFQDLLSAGGRIYHETHFAPLLHMQAAVREIAVDIVRDDGSRLPALVNAVVRERPGGARVIRITVFDATDRRRYEQELVRAREREHEIALELQHALLAGEPVRDDRLRIDVAYRPALRELAVGGDWYDAFPLDRPAAIGAVVGDVVGRGLAAAATMGQLRSAVRALASTGLGPAALLEALDGFVRRHGVGEMATVAYAELDLEQGTMRYACAGHPPPALAAPGSPARLLSEGRSLPLDALGGPAPRPEATVALPAGSAVVLYSDGLVERRDRSLGDGLEQLVATLDRLAGGGDLATAVMETMLGREPRDDDVCVLALRVG